MSVSLASLGLRADNLHCAEGGEHQIPVSALTIAASQGGGTAACVKCRQIVTLSAR